jgi:histone-lysine N-methyltransferase SETD3
LSFFHVSFGRPSSSDQQQAFLSWLSENGVDTSRLGLKDFPGFGLGVVALANIPPGEIVVKIPFSLMLTSQTCFLSDIGHLLKLDEKIKQAEDVLLVVCLLYHMSKPDSFWRPYLDLLPEDRSLITLLSDDMLRELEGTSLHPAVGSRREHVHNEFGYVAENLFKKHPEVFPDTVFNQTSYFWARHIVDSRAWGLQAGAFGLIPMADMFNHKNDFPTLMTESEKQRSTLHAPAHSGYAVGDQIFDSYGNKSNAQLLLSYGFMVDDNEHDSLNINIGFSGATVWDEAKVLLLTKLNFENAKLVAPLFRSHLPQELMRFLRIAHLLPQEVESAQRALSSGGAAVSLRNELAVVRDLLNKIDTFLESYKTSIEEDEAALRRSSLQPILRLVVRYRKAEKEVLHKSRAILLTYWESLLHVSTSAIEWALV